MTLADEILPTGLTVRATISDMVARHIPSAGLSSPVDFSKLLDSLDAKYPIDQRPENLGLTSLCKWLDSKGEQLPANIVRQLRKRWVDAELVRSANAK